ncbi:MAG: hypothetical protein M3Y28_03410 [Armatimonadota bacterium]|nr:hypothetical protein [Armatimonadota bacterium]
MKVSVQIFVYAVLWACAIAFSIILWWMPKLINDSGSFWALLTHLGPCRWLFNLFAMIFTGRHLALFVLFGLVFGVLHLLICNGLDEWMAFKLSLRRRRMVAGTVLGLALGSLYVLYANYSPFQNCWGDLLILLTFIGTGSVVGLLQDHSPAMRLRTESP